MNSEMYSTILIAQIPSNAAKLIGMCFEVQRDNDPKHIMKATQELLKAKKLNVLKWSSQSSDLNPTEHASRFLKSKPKQKHTQTSSN